jgi:hypothetical protein
MSFKKVSDLAKKFQVKLAQDPFAGASPEELSHMPVDKLQDKVFGLSHKPAPVAPKTEVATSFAPTLVNDTATGLPLDLKQMLDIGAPGTKGMLKLTVEGKGVSVAYNADRWTHGATALKRVLTNALSPKYVVGEPIGYNNPGWTFNY